MAAISALRSQSFCLRFSSHKKGFPLKPNEVVHRFQLKNRKDEISRAADSSSNQIYPLNFRNTWNS